MLTNGDSSHHPDQPSDEHTRRAAAVEEDWQALFDDLDAQHAEILEHIRVIAGHPAEDEAQHETPHVPVRQRVGQFGLYLAERAHAALDHATDTLHFDEAA